MPDNGKKKDEMIDLNCPGSGGESRPEDPDSVDIFSPPPPKERIFHTKDGPGPGGEGDLTGSGSFVDGAGDRPSQQNTQPANSRDRKSSGSREGGPTVYRETSWTRHPIVMALMLIILVGAFMFIPHGFSRWWVYLIAIMVTSYWIFPANRWRNRYNMDWESDADPTGCINPFGRWYWWW